MMRRSVESCCMRVEEVVRRVEEVGLEVTRVEARDQPTSASEEGWERIVVGDWTIERKRWRSTDSPWRLRRSWERSGSGRIVQRWWTVALRHAVATEASVGGPGAPAGGPGASGVALMEGCAAGTS